MLFRSASFVAPKVWLFDLADLRRALADGNTERFRRAAHSLKSNSHTYGATKLAELARG